MKITCNNCEELMQKYLCDLPSAWSKQMAKVICKFINPTVPLDCNSVKNCETLTSLSAFTVDGSEVCITYTDENGTAVTRCFDMNDVGLDLDPKCIMDQEDWDLLSWRDQIQAIIDYACTCQQHTTTTTTTIAP
jgi:hypothetical protein